MQMSEEEIHKALGLPPVKQTTPATVEELVLHGIEELEERLRKLVEQHRHPGESYPMALDRFLRENPKVYTAYDIERGRILKRHGIGDIAGTMSPDELS